MNEPLTQGAGEKIEKLAWLRKSEGVNKSIRPMFPQETQAPPRKKGETLQQKRGKHGFQKEIRKGGIVKWGGRGFHPRGRGPNGK